MPKIICATGASLVSVFLLASIGAAMAGTYEALCAGVECKIVIDAKGFSGPAGFMPAHRIAQWYTGGGEENNAAASAAGPTKAPSVAPWWEGLPHAGPLFSAPLA